MSVSLPFFVPFFSVYLFRHLSQFLHRTQSRLSKLGIIPTYTRYRFGSLVYFMVRGGYRGARCLWNMPCYFSYRRFILYWPLEYWGYVPKALWFPYRQPVANVFAS